MMSALGQTIKRAAVSKGTQQMPNAKQKALENISNTPEKWTLASASASVMPDKRKLHTTTHVSLTSTSASASASLESHEKMCSRSEQTMTSRLSSTASAAASEGLSEAEKDEIFEFEEHLMAEDCPGDEALVERDYMLAKVSIEDVYAFLKK